MHDSHSPMTPAEAASLRDASPVDEALLQRIRAALVAKHADAGQSMRDDASQGSQDGHAPATAAGAAAGAGADAAADGGGGAPADRATADDADMDVVAEA